MKYRKRDLLVVLLIVVAINAVTYANTVYFSFTNWDDTTLVVNNGLVHQLSWSALARIFSTSYAANYTPLHLVSYALDYRLWGLNPAGYHVVNVLLHAFAACLLLFVVARITGSLPQGLAVALLFSVHPVQSETVAWIAERKNILFTLFLAGAFLCGTGRSPGRASTVVFAPILFICALLSKPAAVVYPLILVAYDFCVCRRSLFRGLLRNAHYFALTLVAALVTLRVQRGGGIVGYYGGSFLNTQLTMCTVHLRYLAHLLVPGRLSPVYDVPVHASLFAGPVAGSLLVLLGIGAAIVVLLRTNRLLAFWLLWFVFAMAPVSQVVPINTLMADRYLYFSGLGIFGFVVCGISWLWQWVTLDPALERVAVTQQPGPQRVTDGARRTTRVRLRPSVTRCEPSCYAPASTSTAGSRANWRQVTPSVAMIIVLVAIAPLAALTAGQNLIWQDSLSLWTRALEIAPGNPDTHHHLAGAYLDRGWTDEAENAYLYTVQLDPDYTKSYINLAHIYAARGEHRKSIEILEEAHARGATIMELFFNLGVSHYHLGDYPACRRFMSEAIRRYPYFAPAHLFLGNVSYHEGDLHGSIKHYEKALELEPGFAPAMNNLDQIRKQVERR